MRPLVLATALIMTPAAAFAAAPTCAVPPSPQEAAAIQAPQNQVDPSVPVPAPVNPQAQVARAAPETPAATPTPTAAPSPRLATPPPTASNPVAASTPATMQPLSASAISAVPALKRIASAGATLLDLGTEHGLRTIFARKGDAFQVFYLVPDGSAAVGGIMWDASGHDVTRDQVAPIPGVIPTVRIGPRGEQAKAMPAVEQGPGADPLALVKETTYGTIGSSDAPRLWMFVDPFCAFSVRAMQQLEPYVQAGKVRLSVIPLSVLDYEDQGRSTPAAKIMVSEPRGQMVADWIGGSLTGTPPAQAGAELDRNMAVAGALHLRGTPTLIWQNAEGEVGLRMAFRLT